jgi:hypothetical protein
MAKKGHLLMSVIFYREIDGRHNKKRIKNSKSPYVWLLSIQHFQSRHVLQYLNNLQRKFRNLFLDTVQHCRSSKDERYYRGIESHFSPSTLLNASGSILSVDFIFSYQNSDRFSDEKNSDTNEFQFSVICVEARSSALHHSISS